MPACSILISPTKLTLSIHRFTGRSATRAFLKTRECFGILLSSASFRRSITPRVSYYALFNGWLLPSPPSLRHRYTTSFKTLSSSLGTLSIRLGCFPFDDKP